MTVQFARGVYGSMMPFPCSKDNHVGSATFKRGKMLGKDLEEC